MKTYLESVLGSNQRRSRGATALLRYLGLGFDERAKEIHVLSVPRLESFVARLRKIVASFSRDPSATFARLERLVSGYLADTENYRPIVERAHRKDFIDRPLYWVAAHRDEAILLHNNDLVRHFYSFDLWLRTPDDTAWLCERYAAGVLDLERQNQAYFDGILLVAKRYGPHGPILLHEWLRERFPTKAIATLSLRTGALDAPTALQGKRLCVLYDLIHSGSGLQHIASSALEQGAIVNGAVLLYVNPSAPTHPTYPIRSIIDAPLQTLAGIDAPIPQSAEPMSPLPPSPAEAVTLVRRYAPPPSDRATISTTIDRLLASHRGF